MKKLIKKAFLMGIALTGYFYLIMMTKSQLGYGGAIIIFPIYFILCEITLLINTIDSQKCFVEGLKINTLASFLSFIGLIPVFFYSHINTKNTQEAKDDFLTFFGIILFVGILLLLFWSFVYFCYKTIRSRRG